MKLVHHLFCSRYGYHRDLHSFPTRRSSDLEPIASRVAALSETIHKRLRVSLGYAPSTVTHIVLTDDTDTVEGARSEEHTSELQSQSKLVCRLLLVKKNTTMLTQLPSETEPD